MASYLRFQNNPLSDYVAVYQSIKYVFDIDTDNALLRYFQSDWYINNIFLAQLIFTCQMNVKYSAF
jgi:hypothetical protein